MAQVVINEIHYDPADKTEHSEFIELVNVGESAVDLAGWYFSDGFTYTFPEGATLEPGAFLILAQNESGYQRKFGSIFAGGLQAFGQFESGALSNEGERIRLRDAAGTVIDAVNYQATFPWPIAPQGESVQANGDGVSMELIHPSLDNDLAGSWRAGSVPTPGKQNSIYQELGKVPPHIRQVKHEPEAPTSSDEVVISVKVTDPDGVASVSLSYQHVPPGSYIRVTDAEYETQWETLEMHDHGEAPDAMAEDGIYSVTMPEALRQHRHLIRYRIQASDTLGNALQVPYSDDPQPNFAYFVYDGVPGWEGAVEPGETPTISFSAETMNSIAVYHLIATNADIEAQQWGGADREWYGTLVVDDTVYDHMTFSKRGRASRGQVGKEKWDWNFNRGHRFQGRDNYGRPYDVKWREINVLPGTNPWWRNDVSTDGTILNEAVGFRLHELIGSLAANTNYFIMRVIDDAAEAPSNQYEGDLWGLYVAIQDPDSRFIRERGLPDGNVYNWHTGGDIHKNQGANSVTDGSDQREFKNQLRASTSLEWWQANLNFDAYFAFNCGNLMINNSDMRPGDNMMSYYHPDGQCYPIPWDLDLTFEDAPHLGRGDTSAWERLYHVLNHEEVDVLYQNRIREILSLLLNRQQSSMLVDEYARWVWVDVPQSDRLAIVSIGKDGSDAVLTTAEPHGFATGDIVSVEGVDAAVYNGDHVITVVSDTEFSYRSNIFAPTPTGEQIVAYKSPETKPLVLMDQAKWDHHPRKRKKGIYYANMPGNDAEDFKGYQRMMKDFIAPGGYGYELLASHSDDADAPDKPTITYVGDSGYAVDALTFEVSSFSGGSLFNQQSFAAVQWRLAETTNPSLPEFDPTEPRVYEIDADWQSDEIAPFESTMIIPAGLSRPGRHYRVRARMKNTAGHWSLWSDPVEFVAAAPDIALYEEQLQISEIMYHPREATAAERALGYDDGDFEFIELWNSGATALDLTQVRFTKGVDFDFGGSAIEQLDADARVLIVSHLEAFTYRYGEGLPVAGAYSGQLSNGGERLKLAYGAGTAIRDFDYDDGGSWAVDADGAGYSLVGPLGQGDKDLGDGTLWTISARVDGSPGGAEPEGGGIALYAQWRLATFGEDAQDATAAAEADPDGDGRVNWVEYAFHGDPLKADPVLATVRSVNQEVIYRHATVRGDDVTYGVQRSGNLVDWESVTPLGIETGADWSEWRLESSDQATFLRLHVTFDPALMAP